MYNQVYFNFGKRLPFKSVALEKVTVHTSIFWLKENIWLKITFAAFFMII